MRVKRERNPCMPNEKSYRLCFMLDRIFQVSSDGIKLCVCVHVFTYILLLAGEGHSQELGRKRHIGNDVVVIVFQDADCDSPYPPGCITSHFIHVAIVVRPTTTSEPTKAYRVAVQARQGVKAFPPTLPANSILNADDLFGQFLLEKAILGEQAALESESFAPLLKTVKERQLAEITKKYSGTVTRKSVHK
jgi:RAP1 GTPase activating protein 1